MQLTQIKQGMEMLLTDIPDSRLKERMRQAHEIIQNGGKK